MPKNHPASDKPRDEPAPVVVEFQEEPMADAPDPDPPPVKRRPRRRARA